MHPRVHMSQRCQVWLSLVIVCLIVTGCKATSSFTLTLEDNSSGTVSLVVLLDREATSALSSDTYQPISLSDVFSTKDLKAAGFRTSVDKMQDGTSKILLEARYTNQQELDRALAVIAPPEVLRAKIYDVSTLINTKGKATIVVYPSRLKELYSTSEKITEVLNKSNVERSEFNKLIDEAFSATTLTVRLKVYDSSRTTKVTSKNLDRKIIEVEDSRVRIRFLFNMSAAIVCIIAGIYVFFRSRRSSRILLETSREE